MFDAFADNDDKGMRNFERILAPMSEDLEYEIPFRPQPVVLRGVEAFREFIQSTNGIFAGTVYFTRNIFVDEIAQTAIAEVSSRRDILSTKEELWLKYVFVFEFKEAKIARFREYAYSPDLQKLADAMKVPTSMTD